MLTYVPDARDMKIVSCICDDARLPYSKIGSRTRISKDRVRERLKVLEKDLFVLSYFPLINYETLGYRLFHVYARFNKSLDREGPFFAKMKRHERVVALTRIAGRWDVEIQILARNRIELSQILNILGVRLGRGTRGNMILQAKEMLLYSMRLESFNVRKEIIKASNVLRYKADALDLKILYALSENSRTKITDIAINCDVGEDVVRYRIKNLVRNKVILGFYARTNKHRFGRTSYILGLSLKRVARSNELVSLEKLGNVYYMRSFSGRCNLVINFSARDNDELVNTLDFVKGCFGQDLVGLELLTLLDRYKFLTFPIKTK